MVRNALCLVSHFVCLFLPFEPIGLIYLQKLPFTIPELVQSAPCRSSDGMLYTGETVCVCLWARLKDVQTNV